MQDQVTAPVAAEAGGEADFIQKQLADPRILQQIESMPPEERAAFMRQMYQDYSGLTASNTEAMSQADALRSQAAPQGVNAGKQFVAASPLSHLANVGNKFIGAKQYNDAKTAQEGLTTDRTEGLSKYADLLRTEG